MLNSITIDKVNKLVHRQEKSSEKDLELSEGAQYWLSQNLGRDPHQKQSLMKGEANGSQYNYRSLARDRYSQMSSDEVCSNNQYSFGRARR